MDSGRINYKSFCENNDEDAFAELIGEYRDGLIFYLNGYVGNIHVSEELAEDTFVLLGVKKPKDNGKSSFKTWLYTIARNKAIDYLRKNRHGNVSLDEIAELQSEERDFVSQVIADERKQMLYKSLKALKEEYRVALLLFYFEEMSAKSIATAMKKSSHGIETLLYRARKALKTQLEKDGFEYEKL